MTQVLQRFAIPLALSVVFLWGTWASGVSALDGLYVLKGFGAADWRESLIWALPFELKSPGLIATLWAGSVHTVPTLVTAWAAFALWARAFQKFRKKALTSAHCQMAVLVVLFLPPHAELVHVALAVSFAAIFAREVFGGDKGAFLSAPLVAVVFLMVSYPATLADHPLWEGVINGYLGSTAPATYLTGGVDGLYWSGQWGWGVLWGPLGGPVGAMALFPLILAALVIFAATPQRLWAVLGLVLGLSLASGLDAGYHLGLGSTILAAVFVLGFGPRAETTSGQIAQGLIAGIMTVLIRELHPQHLDGVFAAHLFAAISAPLVDQITLKIKARWAKVEEARSAS